MPECLWESIWVVECKTKSELYLKKNDSRKVQNWENKKILEKKEKNRQSKVKKTDKSRPGNKTDDMRKEVTGSNSTKINSTWRWRGQRNWSKLNHKRATKSHRPCQAVWLPDTLIHYGCTSNILNKRGRGASWDFLHCKRSKQRNRCDSNGAFLTSVQVHVTHTQSV